MAPPGRRAFIQLVGVLLVSGALRAGWAHRMRPAATLPGEDTSLDMLADSAARLAAAEARRSRPLEDGERLDPNRAPEEELDRLPGVGPSTARAIVEARDSLPFRSVDEMVRVRGIGDRTLERLRLHLEVVSAPAIPASRRLRRQGTGDGREVLRASPEGADGRGERVNVNRAGAAELQALPGVGPVLAERIVAHRARHGAFRGAEDLRAVSGIGPVLLGRLRPRIRFR